MQATEDFCERLLSMADGVHDHGAARRPTVSTEQPVFSAVLDSITRHMEAAPAAPAVEAPRSVRPGLPPVPAQPPAPFDRPSHRRPSTTGRWPGSVCPRISAGLPRRPIRPRPAAPTRRRG